MLEVGIGDAVITPPLPVSLAGFGEPQLATEVHDDLLAKAVVLRDGATSVTVCLVICDLLGMSPEFERPVRDAVAALLDLDAAAVLVACTHTHSGPSVMRGTESLGWVTPEGYRELLVDGCVEAARIASTSLRAAEARYLRAPLPDGPSINRRGHPYEPWFAAMDFVAPGGERVATLANLSIHPVALGPECLAVSADWVAPFRDALRARTGGAAVMMSGALGDVNPNHVHRQNNDCGRDGFDEARVLGTELAEIVDGALPSSDAIDSSVRIVAQRHFDVTIGGTRLASGRRRPTLPVELTEWAIGPVRLVSIPGEAFHALGHEVDDARGQRTLIAGLAPHWLGYLPVPYVDGGYEEETSYGRAAVEEIRKMLLNVPDPGAFR